MITTDQGMVENVVAVSRFYAHGSDDSVVPALKGEGQYVRNRDTGKHNLTLIIFRSESTGDEHCARIDDRHVANANKSLG